MECVGVGACVGVLRSYDGLLFNVWLVLLQMQFFDFIFFLNVRQTPETSQGWSSGAADVDKKQLHGLL